MHCHAGKLSFKNSLKLRRIDPRFYSLPASDPGGFRVRSSTPHGALPVLPRVHAVCPPHPRSSTPPGTRCAIFMDMRDVMRSVSTVKEGGRTILMETGVARAAQGYGSAKQDSLGRPAVSVRSEPLLIRRLSRAAFVTIADALSPRPPTLIIHMKPAAACAIPPSKKDTIRLQWARVFSDADGRCFLSLLECAIFPYVLGGVPRARARSSAWVSFEARTCYDSL
ncbi:hypothetical protein DFH09DRAFT_1501868 [Mycena vulgaris]|nr:hypothetical protein DFH09DRAFT_1501868 [Mycena vulgaris]